MKRSAIGDEIKQTVPFPDKATEAMVAILRTANTLERKAEAIAATEGISLQQYNVLRILRGARSPLPTMEIAQRMLAMAPGITRLVNNLEEKGLIRREPWPGDRRQVLCQITANGLRLLERLDKPMDEFDSSSARNLTDEQLDHLLDCLTEIRRHHS